MSSSARVCQVVRRIAAARAYGLPLDPDGWASVQRDDRVLKLVANAVGAGLVERYRLVN